MGIEITDYNSKWIEVYNNEAKSVQKALGANCSALHHFGSTAIPGIKAKPKIDILAVVLDLNDININALEKLCFENRGEIIKTGRYFSKKNPKVHLHIFEKNNPLIEKNIKFRDWLRVNEEDRKAYSKLKCDLAKIYDADGGMDYCYAKTDFINKIINKIEKMDQNNLEKFDQVRRLNMPIGSYAITGSGPMGVRNIKMIGDIDIIVSDFLWDELKKKYMVVNENNIEKIVIPNTSIEIFCESSYESFPSDSKIPSVEKRIKQADIIDGLPFESLENILYFKQKMGRDKDKKDIKIIESWKKFH